EQFREPNSGTVLRYIALYRLHATGNRLTTTENRLSDDDRWRLAEYGRAELSLTGDRIRVNSAELVNGRHRRLVWSFYVLDGKIVAGLLEAKLLQARAVLFGGAPLAGFIAVSASMDDLKDPAEGQLTRFLSATQPLAGYLDSVRR